MSLYRKSAGASGEGAGSPSGRPRRTGLRALATALGIGLGLGLFAGCGKSGIEGELAHFAETGHAVAGFADSEPGSFGAKKCQSGTLDQIPALLCEFGGAEAAAAAQPAAERWGGEVGTVVVLRRGPLLFATADRNHADPNGKTLSALAKVFRRAQHR